MMTYGWSGSLTSALDGGEGSASSSGRFVPSKKGLVVGLTLEPFWTLWSTEKSLSPAGNRTQAIKLEARRYIGSFYNLIRR
jgi:hypothetical protein